MKLSPTGYEEVSRFDQPERTRARAWAHPVVLDGKLYLRDQDNMFVYDISRQNIAATKTHGRRQRRPFSFNPASPASR